MACRQLSAILIVLCLNVFMADSQDSQIRLETDQSQVPVPTPQSIIQPIPSTQTKTIQKTPSPASTQSSTISFDFNKIRQNLPDVQIQIPSANIDIDVEGLKANLWTFKDYIVQASFYVAAGAIVGTLIPLALFLILFMLGFTVGGVAAGSLAACCQSPTVIAGRCFSILQKVGATAKLLLLTPYCTILGCIGGIVLYLAQKLFSISFTIDFSAMYEWAQNTQKALVQTLIDTGMGLLIGILIPVALVVILVGLQVGLTSLSTCFQPSSAMTIFSMIKLVKKGINIISFVPNAAILGAFGGLGYSLIQ